MLGFKRFYFDDKYVEKSVQLMFEIEKNKTTFIILVLKVVEKKLSEKKKLPSSAQYKLRMWQKIIFLPKNDGEKWSRKNIFEIPPCAHHVIFITEFVLLIKTPPFYNVKSYNRH